MIAPWPVFAQDEIDAASRVLASGNVNYWTGNEGREFEQEFSRFCDVQYAVALANGTVALEAALAAAHIGPGDEVITTSRTFIASASAAVMRGASPILADVDRWSQNLTAETIAPLINRNTRAIIAVHLAGWPCEMEAINALAEEHDLIVVEDCAQAVGARYRGEAVGSIGHIGAFSFCQDKIMTTGGEGGMLVTNHEPWWSEAWSLKDHGKSYQAVYGRSHAPGFRWLHESFGTNWRMTEVQAAIGRIQLKKLEGWIARRTANAEFLLEALRPVNGLRIPCLPSHVRHAWYKFYVFVEPEALRSGKNRDWIMSEINRREIPCYSGTCSEIYREKAFLKSKLGPRNRLPVAQELGETSLMFLIHPTLSDDDIGRAAEVISSVLESAIR